MAETITVTDSRGQHTLSEVPKRVAVMDWSLLEQVIELGVKPITAADVDSYKKWVVKPTIPESAVNVGTRGEPNLEKIAAAKPDLILITKSQLDLMPRLEDIAPVLYYTNFSKEVNQGEVAIQQFKQLAVVFGKEALAEKKLEKMEARFAELKVKLQQAFGESLPSVVVMRFASTSLTNIYTKNSMADYVLDKLGLKIAIDLPPNQWGITQKNISSLQHITQGYVLYILPFLQEEELQQSILWRAMPFVRNHHINSVPSVWSYGGAMSLMYTAEAFTNSLLEVAPK
jgi:iron complex transport system substrate-binding protein